MRYGIYPRSWVRFVQTENNVGGILGEKTEKSEVSRGCMKQKANQFIWGKSFEIIDFSRSKTDQEIF